MLRKRKKDIMTKTELSLSSPWVIYYNKLRLLFEQDLDVETRLDEDKYEIQLLVNGNDKAEAIAKLLPKEKVFGNTTLTITVIPSNDDSVEALVRKAFTGNEAVYDIATDSSLFKEGAYVLFDPVAVQYFNDSLEEYHGITTTVYQELARDVFVPIEGIKFSSFSV